MRFGLIKRTPADAVFSNFKREEADWTCERCHLSFEQNKGRLHLSHFKTRANPRTRFDPDNSAVLCAGCHDFMGKNPDEHDTFFRRKLGEDRYNALILRANLRRSERLDHKLEKIKWTSALKLLMAKKYPPVLGAKT
jgi:5-methylcytosine-specific restriction endonuclease McrA